MRIVHILPNLKGGGIQNLLLSLAPMQVKMNNEVILIVTDIDILEYSINLRKRMEKQGVIVIYLNRTVGNILSSIITLFKCSWELFKLKPDIINSHGELSHNYAALGSILTKGTHIPTVHNAPEIWNKLGQLLNKKKSIIFCSQSAFDLNHYKNNNSVVIANGVDKNIVVSNKKSNLRSEYKILNNTKLIVGVGSLRKQKNYPFWVDLANACKDIDIRFIVCGGHYGQGYIDPSLFDGVENLTWLSVRSDVSEIINESDCFLSCSTFEGLPIAVLEAFFAGIPCVLSPIPQHSDIAQNISECFIPDKFEVADFKEKIISACASGKSHEMIQFEREPYLKKFSIEKTAKEYINFYNKSIKK